MKLTESDLQLLHDIANRRALLRAPCPPLLSGTLPATMRRRHELMAKLAQLEQQWLDRGLASAGLPSVCGPATVLPPPAAPRVPRAYHGPETHHF